jgi:hypothetical protein
MEMKRNRNRDFDDHQKHKENEELMITRRIAVRGGMALYNVSLATVCRDPNTTEEEQAGTDHGIESIPEHGEKTARKAIEIPVGILTA